MCLSYEFTFVEKKKGEKVSFEVLSIVLSFLILSPNRYALEMHEQLRQWQQSEPTLDFSALLSAIETFSRVSKEEEKRRKMKKLREEREKTKVERKIYPNFFMDLILVFLFLGCSVSFRLDSVIRSHRTENGRCEEDQLETESEYTKENLHSYSAKGTQIVFFLFLFVVERKFLRDEGLRGRSWWKHPLFATPM